jgi:LPS export ABC transporter protein LptC
MDKFSCFRRLLIALANFIGACSLLLPALLAPALLFFACSFDYGNSGSAEKGLPDIVMDNVEYVRVRSLDPQARLQAERVERYEERRVMALRNFSFEQFGNHGEEVNAFGRAGSALFEIDSGDIRMENGVLIEVDSEEIAIETARLEWKDKERTLSGGESEEVQVFQENGTSFTGIGFQANARTRSWSFSDTVSGIYTHDDDDEDAEQSPREPQ